MIMESVSTLVKIILGVVAAFAAICLGWYLMIKAPYADFCNNIVESGGEHIITGSTDVKKYRVGDYEYTVVQPTFLKNNGSLYIKHLEKPDADILISRSITGRCSYTLTYTMGYKPDIKTWTFKFTSDMQPETLLSMQEKSFLNKNGEIFTELLEKANSMWGLSLEMKY